MYVPAHFAESRIQAIVGIEIPIARLVGKWKVSQNRSEVDREGIVADLRESVSSPPEMIELLRHAVKP